MTLNNKTAFAEAISFTEVVDNVCCKLKDKQIKYSIHRLMVMEDRLSALEKELDDFLQQGKMNEK